ncbi:MAG: hypothetical protein QN178_14485 [Armatimonadota bacterium]|nr:hypothetical protein [Armatimonadota bacterium]
MLAAVVLASVPRAGIRLLPYLVNYPLHLRAEYPRHRRPRRLNDVVTCWYEKFFDNPR